MPSITSIYGSGILNRIDLKDKNELIRGYLSIKTTNNNIISFNVYQPKITSNNKINPSYKAFKTIMSKYKDSTNENPDRVAIRLKDKYPNAGINVRTLNNSEGITTQVMKNLRFLNRVDESDDNIIFKILGCYVENLEGTNLNCRILNYHEQSVPIKLINKSKTDISKEQVLDVVGYIREGLRDGIPVCEYQVVKVRKSEDYNVKNFIDGMEKYKEYTDSLMIESPF